ncbi:MAG: hypothetical protein MUF86_00390 [Akkermansiaceae bacterium]|jgi:hypothetical protein|nr:hypothetical protein [Akkermansiaceae bacterium]MCU0776112.1 hypothetical protein [Akkermansiaceae bacterium]
MKYETEQDIRREFCKPKDRVISAILASRRASKRRVFYVHPQLAAAYGVNPKQLGRTLDDLEGRLVVTVESTRGRYRRIRLVDRFEFGDF